MRQIHATLTQAQAERDELKAQLARVEAEKCDWTEGHTKMAVALGQAQAEKDRLLEKYAHTQAALAQARAERDALVEKLTTAHEALMDMLSLIDVERLPNDDTHAFARGKGALDFGHDLSKWLAERYPTIPPQQKGEQPAKPGHWFDLRDEWDSIMRDKDGDPLRQWCDDPACPHNRRARQQKGDAP